MSLLVNPAILEQTFLPRLLPYREEQHRYLADCIKPLMNGRSGMNLLITGGVGIGKTACVRFILRMLTEETDNIMPIYVNCWKRDTTPKIVNDIADQMGIKTVEKASADEIFDKLIEKFSKCDGVVFAFDEIDRVTDFDFLYRILEDVPRKTVFLITNVNDWVAKVDRRLMSRLTPDRVEFKPYKFEEVRGVLFERQRYAFAPNAWEYEAFENVIRKTFLIKDIRSGLFLMKTAAEIAETRNATRIGIDDVANAIEKLDKCS